MGLLVAELGQLRSDHRGALQCRDEAMGETQRLQSLCAGQRSSIDALNEEMGRQVLRLSVCVCVYMCMCLCVYVCVGCLFAHIPPDIRLWRKNSLQRKKTFVQSMKQFWRRRPSCPKYVYDICPLL